MKEVKKSKILKKIRLKAKLIKGSSVKGGCYPWDNEDGGEWSDY